MAVPLRPLSLWGRLVQHPQNPVTLFEKECKMLAERLLSKAYYYLLPVKLESNCIVAIVLVVLEKFTTCDAYVRKGIEIGR